MFRFLKDSAQFMLLALVYIRYAVGLNTYAGLKAQLQGAMRARPNAIPDNINAWVNISVRELDNEIDERTNPDGIIDILTAQMGAPHESDGDKFLIDTLIQAVGLPFNRRFNSDRMKAIQKAILTPNEMATVRSKILRTETTCGSCGLPFRNGELITFTGHNTEQVSLMCYRCTAPTYVACTTCHSGDVAQITKKFYVGSTTKCVRHDDKPTEPQTIDDRLGALRRRVVPVPEPTIWNALDNDIMANELVEFRAARAVPMPPDPDGELDEEL